MNVRAPLLGVALAVLGLALVFMLLPREIPPPAPVVNDALFIHARAYSLISSLAIRFPRRDDLLDERRATVYGLFTPLAVLGFLAGVSLYLNTLAVTRSREKPR